VDAEVTFDNVGVGAMQAEGVIKVKPKGNYYLLGGDANNNNSHLLRDGQLKALKPYVDRGDIKILGDQWIKDWSPVEALSVTENILTANKNKVDAIVASNDGLAGGAIQALTGQGLAGKVAVSGQDSDLAAIKRIVDGTQTATVYKSLKLIASSAAKMAVAMAKGEPLKTTTTQNNGFKDVPTLQLDPVLITKDNIDVLIKDGFYTKEQIFGK
jgi:D-xylose transport system substrate-binding protein